MIAQCALIVYSSHHLIPRATSAISLETPNSSDTASVDSSNRRHFSIPNGHIVHTLTVDRALLVSAQNGIKRVNSNSGIGGNAGSGGGGGVGVGSIQTTTSNNNHVSINNNTNNSNGIIGNNNNNISISNNNNTISVTSGGNNSTRRLSIKEPTDSIC